MPRTHACESMLCRLACDCHRLTLQAWLLVRIHLTDLDEAELAEIGRMSGFSAWQVCSSGVEVNWEPVYAMRVS